MVAQWNRGDRLLDALAGLALPVCRHAAETFAGAAGRCCTAAGTATGANCATWPSTVASAACIRG